MKCHILIDCLRTALTLLHNIFYKKLLPFSYIKVVIFSCCTIVLFSTSLILTPIYASGLFSSMGLKEELELGKKFNLLVRSQMAVVEDPEIVGYIQSIVDQLAASMPPQPFQFKASVVLNNSVNAFAIPGGYVFVNTGLIMNMENESELVGALAHELAHVTQRHIARRMERAQIVNVASILGALASVFLGGGNTTGAVFAGSLAAGQTAMLNYSRSDETEADQIGLQYLVKAGFKPQGMEEAFEKIRRKQWASGASTPEYLSTHPDIGERINEIHSRVASLPQSIQARVENNKRFKRVRTLIWARYGEPETAYWLFTKSGEKDCLALMGLGILAERKNKIKVAEDAFHKAVVCAPNDALILREAGMFYYNRGDGTQSIQFLKKALSLDSKDVLAQFFYARALDDAGNSTEAQTYYKQLLKILPEDAEVHYIYGRSLGQSGNVFEAYIHLAYSALYQNDIKKFTLWSEKARSLAKTSEQENQLKSLMKIHEERVEITTQE